MSGLDPSRIAEVDILLAPLAVQGRNFGNLLLLGDSSVIDPVERIRSYSTIGDVATDFGTTAPEYLAALPFFSQSPQPVNLMMGRWAASASHGILHGGRRSAAQQALSNFVGVTSGGFTISVDGTPQTVTGLSLYSQTNLNGIASAITAALSGATCVWDAVAGRFDIKSSSSGAGLAATGYANFGAGNPANNDTLTINGTAVTFKTTAPVGAQVLIMDTPLATCAATLAYFVANPIAGLAFSQEAGGVLRVTSTTVGTAGNAKTLAKSSSTLAVSGATLGGGTNPATVSYAASPPSGTDISTLLGLTSTLASAPVSGSNAETLAQAVALLADRSPDWYGLYVASTASVADSDYLAVAAFVEAANPSRLFGITTQSGAAVAAPDTTSIGHQLKQLGYSRTFWQYSSSNPYAAISIFGREFTVNFGAVDTTITIKFKQEPGIVAETLTTTQADTIEGNHGNVFVNYSNGAAILEQGTVAGGRFIDEVHGLDWLQNACQIAVFNALYQSLTKIPQTDEGITSLMAAVAAALEQGVRNGLIAPGVWTAQGFADLRQGDYLPLGYHMYCIPLAQQNQSDREARKAPPIQVAVKLAGAIHSAVIQINVNR